ncbi:MAG: hypothetical protein BGO69_04310 [Bacteroidetes bacterium 46-16]|nr:MAG: hypothetical protein BGO69_04310 [Bacteroidetes bacterium 46-16]
MRFAIRDDDTNFFTSPEELEACYGDIWNDTPVSLCLISKVKGNWAKWVHQIYKDKQDTDWDAWTKDDTVYPIEDNAELVSYLREKIKEGKVDIGFHAIHHRNEDDALPGEMNNNYVRGAEFYTGRDLTEAIKTEVAHLGNVFQYPITVFTPPQNLLSMKGYKAVVNAGLNICGGGLSFMKKEKDLKGIVNLSKQLTFKLMHRESDYPYVVKYSTHAEAPYHYPLQPGTLLRTLTDAFDMVHRYNGDFILSTHYVEFDYPMVYDETKTMKNIMHDFLDYVSGFDVERVSLSQLLKK